MVWKAMKEVLTSPKADAKVKALKAKKAQPQKQDPHITPSWWSKTLRLQRQLKNPLKSLPGRSERER